MLSLIWSILWILLITQARHHWGDASYYNFGWAVPFLAGYLLFKNFQSLPIKLRNPTGVHNLWVWILLAVLIPFHALSEVNPFWRAPLWIQFAILSSFSLWISFLMYGRCGIKRALSPLLLLSTMIPWPYRIETSIIQEFTVVVSEVACNVLVFFGYPFELSGNSLTMGAVQIGVNEACSGIRSLQALFMMTIFASSVLAIPLQGKLLSILMLPVVVLITNTARAVFLSLVVVSGGNNAYDRWHDAAGIVAFGISMGMLAGVLFVAVKLMPARKETTASTLAIDSSMQLGYPPLAAYIFLPILVWALVEGWFRWHEMVRESLPKLTFTPPDNSSVRYGSVPIPSQIKSVLGYSYGQRFVMRTDRLDLGEVYFYSYTADNRIDSVSSYGHSPLICMEAIGASLKEYFPPLLLTIYDAQGTYPDGHNRSTLMSLNLSHAEFQDQKGRRIHVFWKAIEANTGGIDADQLAKLDYKIQMQLLQNGRRDYSRQVLLLSINGKVSAQIARQYAKQILGECLLPEAEATVPLASVIPIRRAPEQ
jgi:exosortase/archaeosortase family protein